MLSSINTDLISINNIVYFFVGHWLEGELFLIPLVELFFQSLRFFLLLFHLLGVVKSADNVRSMVLPSPILRHFRTLFQSLWLKLIWPNFFSEVFSDSKLIEPLKMDFLKVIQHWLKLAFSEKEEARVLIVNSRHHPFIVLDVILDLHCFISLSRDY